ncbi:MAG: translesion DNA synthesis-associated protein ImuA [Burkholderiales bacterium]
MKSSLLRQGEAVPPRRILPSGFTDLDRVLPGGGWPIGALTEILNSVDEGIGELSLLMPAIAAASRSGQGVVLVNAPHIPFPAAWLAKGVVLENCSFITTDNLQEALWSTEQSLLSGACSLVIFWQPEGKVIEYKALHRLHLAALNGKTPAILFRSRRDGSQASPAALRLLVTSMAGELAVRVIKRRDIPLDHAVYLALHPVIWKRRQASLHSNVEQTLFIQETARPQFAAH